MRAMSTIDQSVYDGLRIFLLSVCFIPYLLFDKNRLLILILGILPTLISILFFDPLLQFTGVGYESIGYVSDDHQLMSVRTIIAYTVISISCLVFQTIISQNDKFNKKLVSELRNRTEEIEAQNEMLVESQLRLNEINQHLEELVEQKAQDIKRQNEILINYSFTNAHHVRGPVARILGLIQLSKIKTDLNYPWFFEKVEHEAIEIDKIIKRISEDLNDTEIR
jgi:signal transduction histidine kinase